MQIVTFALTLVVGSALHLRPAQKDAEPASGPIFYMTAMAKLAAKHQTRLWLESLRHNGKWTGEIVIITDKPACLAKNLGEALLGKEKLSETEKLTVYPGGEGHGKIYMMTKPSTTNVKAMKQEKALAWLNMRELGLNPSMVIHTDQDIVFGKEVAPAIAEAQAVPEGHTMALFKDQGVTKGQLHTGIMFLFPGENTDICLADWAVKIMHTHSSKYHGFKELPEAPDFEKEVSVEAMSEAAGEQLEAEAMGPDQRALGGTKSCKAGKGVAILSASHLMMPKSGSLEHGQTATFIHFTNTNRWKSIKSPTKKKYFVEVLGLDEMDWDGYTECPVA